MFSILSIRLLLLLYAPIVEARSPLTDSLDVEISTHFYGESSIFVNPANPDAILLSAAPLGGSPLLSFVSTNGGTVWAPDTTTVSGDPSVAISADTTFGDYGRFVVMAFKNSGQGTDYKDSPSPGWTTSVVTDDVDPTDKGFVWVDNGRHSSREHHFVAAWSGESNEIDITWSDDGAETWEDGHTDIRHDSLFKADAHWGVNVKTGRKGHIYAIWSRMQNGLEGTAVSFGFTEATDSQFLFPLEAVLLSGTLRDVDPIAPGDATSTPSMTVDTGDSSADSLFVVFPQRTTTSSQFSDVMLMKGYRDFSGSSVVWDEDNLIRVNVDTDKKRWWPWASWDDCTGFLTVAWMEGGTQTKVAVSPDRGTTWEEFVVSDTTWDATMPLAGYDYIGLATGDGRAFPAWSDNRDNPGTDDLRLYVSPLLLWGVEQDSLSVCYDDTADSLSMSITWTTNIGATVRDSLTLISPTTTYTVACDTCSTNGGRNHALEITVPREHGTWRYTVTSRRSNCIQPRTSDPDTLFVPNITTSSMDPTSFTCPAGDGAHYVANLDFDHRCSSIAASRMSLEPLPMDTPNRAIAFFPQTQAELADSAATTTNGHATTITEQLIGGCTGGWSEIYLDDVVLDSVFVDAGTSVDLNGTGYVDSGDIVALATFLDSCEDSLNYDSCADFVPDAENCIGDAELDSLVAHLGHNWTQPLSKGGGGGGNLTILHLDSESPVGFADFTVLLTGVQDHAAAGIILRPDPGKLEFASWQLNGGSDSAIRVIPSTDAQGPRVTLVVLGATPDPFGEIELGKLHFSSLSGTASASDLAVVYEDITLFPSASGAIAAQLESGPGHLVTRLHPNRPNPFNPFTQTSYTLAASSSVSLSIYDVSGRRVRTLVQEGQPAGEYLVQWDGADDSGTRLASGIYLLHLRTERFEQSRKMVLIR